MGVRLENILWLGIKELRGLFNDPILLFLIGFSFAIAVYALGTGAKIEVVRSSVEIVDEDRSELSRRLQLAPTTRFVSFAQAVLYRGAGFAIVWPDLAAITAMTIVVFGIS
jgi:hypothetical protein